MKIFETLVNDARRRTTTHAGVNLLTKSHLARSARWAKSAWV